MDLASMVKRLSRGFDRGERIRLVACYGAIALVHVVGWGALLTYGVGHPAFLGLGGLAYTFGLRHAFDADHISAIDNTTRKLLQQKQKPVSVGFWFSLGHCTVVLLIALALGFAVHTIVNGVVGDSGQLRNVGGLVGTSVSGFFLVMIGIVNLVVLLDIVRALSQDAPGRLRPRQPQRRTDRGRFHDPHFRAPLQDRHQELAYVPHRLPLRPRL